MQNLFIMIAIAAAMTPAWSQGEVASGPRVGSSVPELKVFAVTGEPSGKELDYAAERGAKPTIYIFIPHERFDRPIARFLKELEKGIKDTDPQSAIVTVFLTDDEAKVKEHLPKVQTSLQFTINSMCVFPSTKIGPEGWGINSDAHLTAVVVQSGKVQATFGERSVNETLVPDVTAAMKRAIGK